LIVGVEEEGVTYSSWTKVLTSNLNLRAANGWSVEWSNGKDLGRIEGEIDILRRDLSKETNDNRSEGAEKTNKK
jgi:hypothetical protein